MIAVTPRVVVVDDAPEYVEIVSQALAREGLEVASATTGTDALAKIRSLEPDVVVLDLMLPDVDGVEVCRRLRAFSDAYVLMLTARDDEIDKVVGLSVGADDYVTKPFSARELVARVGAMLRRPRFVQREASVRVGDLELDPGARTVSLGDAAVDLTRIEFDLLAALAERPGTVAERARLVERVWGSDWYGHDHVLDVHVSNLRRKLDEAQPRGGGRVETVRGVGYRLRAEEVPGRDGTRRG